MKQTRTVKSFSMRDKNVGDVDVITLYPKDTWYNRLRFFVGGFIMLLGMRITGMKSEHKDRK